MIVFLCVCDMYRYGYGAGAVREGEGTGPWAAVRCGCGLEVCEAGRAWVRITPLNHGACACQNVLPALGSSKQ